MSFSSFSRGMSHAHSLSYTCMLFPCLPFVLSVHHGKFSLFYSLLPRISDSSWFAIVATLLYLQVLCVYTCGDALSSNTEKSWKPARKQPERPLSLTSWNCDIPRETPKLFDSVICDCSLLRGWTTGSILPSLILSSLDSHLRFAARVSSTLKIYTCPFNQLPSRSLPILFYISFSLHCLSERFWLHTINARCHEISSIKLALSYFCTQQLLLLKDRNLLPLFAILYFGSAFFMKKLLKTYCRIKCNEMWSDSNLYFNFPSS